LAQVAASTKRKIPGHVKKALERRGGSL